MSNFAELREKITSEEQLAAALLKIGFGSLSSYKHIFCTNNLKLYRDAKTPGGSVRLTVSWWAVREYLRLDQKVYEVTDVLRFVNDHHPMAFAHVSLEDRKMVAYTVDKAGGEADRQVRLTIGRLLSKLFPLFTDEVIAAMATEHNAEISDEVFFLEGEDIAAFYAVDTKTSACMSSKSFDYQPTLAYNAPGIRMAVVKDAAGIVNGRAMVYEVSETDKRYIRTYGSPLLQKRLIRKGYKVGTWCGATFNTIYAETGKPFVEGEEGADGEVKLALPYLDSNGGMSGEGSAVALLGGKLVSLTQSQRQMLETSQRQMLETSQRAESKILVAFGSSTGYVRLHNIPSSELSKTCLLSGQTYNIFTDPVTYVYNWDTQQHGTALTREVPEDWVQVTKADMMTSLPSEVPKTFRVPPAQLTYHRGRMQIISPEFYAKAGYLKLDPAYYSEDLDSWKAGLRQTKEGLGILAADAAKLYEDPNGEGVTVHVKDIQALGRKLIKLHTVPNEIAGYATQAAVHITASGRKVHPKYNFANIVRTPIGWEFRRNTTHENFYVLGVTYARHKSQSASETEASLRVILEREVQNRLENGNIGKAIVELYQELSWTAQLLTVHGKLVGLDDYSEMPLADLQYVLQQTYDGMLARLLHDSQKAFVIRQALQYIAQANATDFNTEVRLAEVTDTVTANAIEVTALPSLELTTNPEESTEAVNV